MRSSSIHGTSLIFLLPIMETLTQDTAAHTHSWIKSLPEAGREINELLEKLTWMAWSWRWQTGEGIGAAIFASIQMRLGFFQRWNREPVAVVVVVVVVACLRNLKFFESSQSLRSPSLLCFPCCFQTPFERPPSFKTPPPFNAWAPRVFQFPRLVAKVAQPKN